MNAVSDTEDDDLLAAKSRKGDSVALARLYRRHAPALLGYLERCTSSRAEAEDVLQETFLRLFEGRGRYDGRGRFRPWLFTVATHLVLDRTRRDRRHAEILAAAGSDWLPSADVTSDAFLVPRTQQRIDQALADLPPEYALAFHLRVREGFSYAEIAAMSGAPEGTLRSRVHHAVRRIRTALALDAGPDPQPPGPGQERAQNSCHDGEPR